MKKRFIGFAALAAVTAVLTASYLPEAVSAQRGKYDRFVTNDLKRSMVELQRNKIPTFGSGIDAEGKMEVIRNLDEAMAAAKNKGLPAGLADAIALWEKMSDNEKVSALSGGTVLGMVPAAAAVVGAAALGYAFAKDVCGLVGTKVRTRSMNREELDYVEGLRAEGFGAGDRASVASSGQDLDYQLNVSLHL